MKEGQRLRSDGDDEKGGRPAGEELSAAVRGNKMPALTNLRRLSAGPHPPFARTLSLLSLRRSLTLRPRRERIDG